MPLPVHLIAAELHARQPGLGKLKLHKLLYYCQGHHLATFGEPLFAETISAWDHGPVVGELWFVQDREIETEASTVQDEAALNTIGYVVSRYGALSGRDLEHLTHSEDPWRRADADRRPRTSTRILREWLQEYFTLRAGDEDDDEDAVLDAEEVARWLQGARARRDVPGPRDDRAEIRRRIEELGGAITR